MGRIVGTKDNKQGLGEQKKIKKLGVGEAEKHRV